MSALRKRRSALRARRRFGFRAQLCRIRRGEAPVAEPGALPGRSQNQEPGALWLIAEPEKLKSVRGRRHQMCRVSLAAQSQSRAGFVRTRHLGFRAGRTQRKL